MPRIINFGDVHGNVSFPDDATDQQIAEAYKLVTAPKPPTVGEMAQQVGRSLVQGVGNTLASIPEGISRLRDAGQAILPESLAPAYRAVSAIVDPTAIVDQVSGLVGGPNTSQLLRGTGSLIRRGTEAVSPEPVRGLEDSFLATKLPQGIGSALAFIGGGLAGAAAKVPAWLSIAGLGAGAGAEDFYQDAKRSGADERTASIASLIGGAVGTSEAIPMANIINRLDKVSGNIFSRALINAGKETIEEALQEAGQQLAQNVTAKQLYDQDRGLFENVVGNAGVGGATGALLSIVASAVGAGRQRGARSQSDLESEERIKQVLAERENQNVQTSQVQAPSQGQEISGLPSQTQTVAPAGWTWVSPSDQVTLTPDVVSGIVSDVSSKWANSPRINVVESVDQLPASVRAYSDQLAQRSDGFGADRIAGVKDPSGQIWMVSRNLTSDEHARRILLHEAIGHLGVEAVIQDPQAFTQFMQGVAERHAATQLGQEVMAIYGQDPVIVGKEVVAKLAENPGADPSLWNQIVAAVRGWVRQVFNIEVSDNDIKVLLSKAKAKVERGEPTALASVATAQPGFASETDPGSKDAPVVYKGYQPGFGSIPGFDLFNLTDTIAPNLVKGSTVTADALRKAGFNVPASEQAKATAGRPQEGQGTSFAVSDRNRDWWVGNVHQGEVRAFQNRDATHGWLVDNGYNIGDLRQRWRYEPTTKQVVWSDEPTPESKSAVENFLYKKAVSTYGIRHNVWLDGADYNYSKEPSFAVNPQTPQFFQTRSQVLAAQSNPGLAPDQIQEAEQLASVQSAMATDEIVGWIMQSPKDDAQKYGQDKLSYIEDRKYLSPSQTKLSNLPEGTTEEQRLKEMAGALTLGHYSLDRQTERVINRELEADQALMSEAIKKIPKLNNAKIKANFLEAMFKGVVKDYKKYLASLTAAEPASQNMQAQWRENLNRAQERLNIHEQSPTALKNALSAIAYNIPDTLLLGGTNQAIVDWTLTNGILFDVVSDNVRDWMLVNDGAGSPAMLKYTKLIPDLIVLKDILTKQQEVGADIKAFETWFSNTGKETGISAKQFAERYFKFRTGRDRALKIIASIEKEIGDLDTRIRGNQEARDRLQTMMTSPDYVATVREAADKADIVVRALYDSQDNKTGLIDRDRAVGLWKLKGPISNTEYVVDLYPSSAQEAQNRSNLSAWMGEARQWATDNTTSDPLLADEYNNLAQYIERYLIHPSLDPKNGSTQIPWVKIPFTNIRFNPDIFDAVTGATGSVGYSFQTIRDVLERVGGRAMRQAVSEATTLDTVMRKIEAINANKVYGYQAQTQAILKALQSHGWNSEQFAVWDETIAEPVLASSQNRLGPEYQVGDVVVGAKASVTAEDMAAFKLMKQWGDALLAVAPAHVQEKMADLGVTRKAIGNGRFTGHRIAAPWTRQFMVAWNKATTDVAKLDLIKEEPQFKRVVLGYLSETNPEFAKMNPASKEKAPLFDIYRRLSNTEKSGVQTFSNWDEVIDFIANEMVSDGIADNHADAVASATEKMLSEIKGFVGSFDTNVLGYENNEVWGAVPSSVVQMASANNAFTTPRGRLLAPSTFYSYSTASDGRRLNHVGSLRSLLNLKLLQSGYEAKAALEIKKTEMENRIKQLTAAGATTKQARAQVLKETTQSRKLGEIRYDHYEIVKALRSIEQAFGNLERYEKANADHYEHAGVAAWNNVFGTIKSSLLSSTQAISTNFWSGSLLGPALVHWQSGQFLKAVKDIVPAPHMWRTVMSRVAAMVEGNPSMKKLLKTHNPLFEWMSKMVIEAATDWRHLQRIAQGNGMVNPYNLGNTIRNKRQLRSQAGRLTTDDPHAVAEWANKAMGAPVILEATETLKATAPRLFDNLINYAMVAAFEQEVEFLKKAGWNAFKNREELAIANGTDWKDLSNPDNALRPEDLGLRSNKGLNVYRQLFAPLGSLDYVLMDYYEKTKALSPDDREKVELLNDDDYGALALQYAAISNVSTETNRPFALKGKGSDGVWRNIIGTFLGWSINMMKQFSKALQTHSADPKAPQIWNNMLGLATIVVLLSAVGAWNWEFGDELTKQLYGQTSARIQVGNIDDVITGFKYFIQSLVNTVPIVGSSIGGMFGIAFTGRGNPFDMASLSPHIGFVSDVFGTTKRIIQTGDAVLPLADFTKRWIPLSKIAINRLPVQRGIVDQNNAIRALNASAPPGTEIKWGQRGSGDVRYGPANDEIQRLIASAYEATAHGGTQGQVQVAMQEAINAYIRAGRSPDDAEKAVATALAAKEPVRVLTGREMTPEEEQRWVKRMTKEQLVDYNKAKNAWALLSLATGKDFNMVSTGRSSSGGGGGSVAGLPSMIPAGPSSGGRRIRIGAIPSPAPFRPVTSGGGRIRRPRTGRRIRSVLRRPRSARSPRISTRRTGIRRRRSYARI